MHADEKLPNRQRNHLTTDQSPSAKPTRIARFLSPRSSATSRRQRFAAVLRRFRKRPWGWITMLGLSALLLVTLLLTRSESLDLWGTVFKNTPPSTPTIATGLMFIENVGQFDPAVRFQAFGGDRHIWLTQDAIWVTVLEPVATHEADTAAMPASDFSRTGVNLKLSFAGANPTARLEALQRLETRAAYLIGNTPATWRVDVPVWRGVRYVNLYPGADLIITTANGKWDWRLELQDPTFDLTAVKLQVEGAESVTLDTQRGAPPQALHLETAVGEFTVPLLQLVGETLPEGAPQLEGEELTFPFVEEGQITEAPTAAGAQSSVLPPNTDLFYSTYLLGTGKDWAQDIAVDATGAAYVAGSTNSLDFPTTPGAFDTTYNGGIYDDIFVVKLTPDGTALEYATFIGGTHHDYASAIAVEAPGHVYLTGGTRSGDFPTTANAFDRLCGNAGHCDRDTFGNPRDDAFALKLDATGSALLYATFIGGSGSESGSALKIDAAGYAYLVGSTDSGNFPTTAGALSTTPRGLYDVFVTKLDPTGATLAYSTLIGGSGNDSGVDLALGASGSVLVTGVTFSPDFPTTPGALNTTHSGGGVTFVLKLQPHGSALDYATFLGGNGLHGRAITVDAAGTAYIAGNAMTAALPTTPGALQRVYKHEDVFIARLAATGDRLLYATYLGGTGSEASNVALALDTEGYLYIAGNTKSADFPTTANAFSRTYNADASKSDIFIARLNPIGSALAYATFLGGSGNDLVRALALDAGGAAYLTGYTASIDFPTTPNAWAPTVTTYADYDNGFVAKMQLPPSYAISGQVRDSAGLPLVNIPVTLNAERTVRTDADGYYIFTELPANAYSLEIPEAFHGISLAPSPVSVPPDFAHYDFVVLPQPIAQTFLPGSAGEFGYQDAGGGATLYVPATALTLETTLVLTPTWMTAWPKFILIGVAFDLEAYPQGIHVPNFTFTTPTTLNVTYHAAAVAPEREHELLMVRWSGTQWEDAAATCGPTAAYTRDVETNRLSFALCRTGRLALVLPQQQVFLPLVVK